MCRLIRLLVALCPVLALSLGGCAQLLPGDTPSGSVVLYYPMSIAVSPDGSMAYLVNSNFDQRFNAGWVTSVDVGKMVTDPNNARAALSRQAYIPSLGGRLSISADGNRAYVPHRGSGLLTVLDIAGPSVTCSSLAPGSKDTSLKPVLQYTSCDSAHLVDLVAFAKTSTASAPNYTYNYRDFQDAYSVSVVANSNDLQALNYDAPLVVGYLQSGWMTVLNANSTSPVLGAANIYFGSTTLANIIPHGAGWVMATSQRSPASSDKSIVYDTNLAASLQPEANQQAQYVRGDVGGNLAGIDIVDAAFSPDGQRLYVSNRSPDSVVVLRVSPFAGATQVNDPNFGALPQATAYNTWQPVSSVAIDDTDPTDMVYIARSGGTDLVAVASLLQDVIYFFAPRGDTLQLVQRVQLQTGQGPMGMRPVKYLGKDYLLVTTFFDHGVALIDISSASYADFRVLTKVSEDDLGIAPRGR